MILTTDQAEQLVASIAPELLGRVQVLEYSERLGPCNADTTAAYAVYDVRGGNPIIRRELQRQGRWRDRPTDAIVFLEPPTAATVIHEAAHLVPVRTPLPDPPLPALLAEEATLRMLTRWAAQPFPLEPWAGGHDLPFLRRCCHLWARCEPLGIPVRQCDFRAVDWADHDIDEYRRRLGWEPTRCRGWSFAQIEAEPIPAYFSDLFTRDQAAWLRWKETT